MSTKNLYSYTTFFKLSSGGKTIYIDEPIHWDKSDIQVPRDKNYFGFISEFVSDEVSLEFPIEDREAYDFIKNIYDAKGSDGDISFQFGIVVANVEKVLFAATINLNTYVNEDYTITVSVEKVNFQSLFRTRYDTPIDFSKTVNLDNKPISPPTPHLTKLHSRQITKEFKSFTTDPRSASNTDSGGAIARYLSIQLDTTDSQVKQLPGSQGLPLSVSGIDPRDNSLYYFKVAEAGNYDLSFTASFHLAIQFLTIGGIGDYNLIPRFAIVRGGATIELTTFNQYYISGNTSSNFIEFNYAFDIQHLKRQLQVNDELFFDCTGVMGHSGSPYNYYVTNFMSTVDVTAETTAPPTYAYTYRAFDVITKMVEYATGMQNAVRSSIFGPGGCLYKEFCTNGYQIRNFLINEKPFIGSIKDFIESWFPIEGLGYGVETIDGVEYLVIEQFSYWFRNREITRVGEVSAYREEHASSLVFNEYEVGFEKFPDASINGAGVNTLDEYNTYQTGLFPIRTYKGKFTKKSKWIASGYALEIQRREQFAENPSDSLSNDDDIFIISCIEGTATVSANYFAQSGSKKVNSAKDLGLTVGQTFTIVRGGFTHSNDGKTLTVNAVINEPDGSFSYIVDETIVDEMGLALFSFTVSGVQAERNEMFNYVTGLLSPETAYNLRKSPRRILLNWSPFLNIGLVKKLDTDLIQNTFVKNNSSMSSSLDLADECRRFEHTEPVVESSDITVANFRNGNRVALHEPTFAYFKSYMKYDQFNLIKTALTGDSQTENDHGYIVHPDRDGILWKSFIYLIKYSPKSELADLQVAKFEIY